VTTVKARRASETGCGVARVIFYTSHVHPVTHSVALLRSEILVRCVSATVVGATRARARRASL
jgi:hypothetical protein